MSDAVFPELRGLAIGIKKEAEFKTIEQVSAVGIIKSLSLRPYPIWNFTLSYEVLTSGNEIRSDIQDLIGFYTARKGKFEDFLYKDLYDNYCSGERFGTGDGTTTNFQLVRSFGESVEPVIGILKQPVILVNGVPTTAFTWTTKGKITFTTAPDSGAVLIWAGEYYFRCKFTEDRQEFQEIVNGVWQVDSVLFRSLLI